MQTDIDRRYCYSDNSVKFTLTLFSQLPVKFHKNLHKREMLASACKYTRFIRVIVVRVVTPKSVSESNYCIINVIVESAIYKELVDKMQ